MKTEVRISGLGGQGIVLAGQILGKAAAYDGKNVVQTQSYGSEARGSVAKSEIVISDTQIGYPMVRKCDILVGLSQEAVDKNIKDLKEEGTLLVDDSIVKNLPDTKARIYKISATKIAESSCSEKLYANIVMLGALIRFTKIISAETVEKAIKDSVPKKAVNINIQAFRKGLEE
jgi:2-oxoglutarate ferredoxin oxidoreductase subunit gamma